MSHRRSVLVTLSSYTYIGSYLMVVCERLVTQLNRSWVNTVCEIQKLNSIVVIYGTHTTASESKCLFEPVIFIPQSRAVGERSANHGSREVTRERIFHRFKNTANLHKCSELVHEIRPIATTLFVLTTHYYSFYIGIVLGSSIIIRRYTSELNRIDWRLASSVSIFLFILLLSMSKTCRKLLYFIGAGWMGGEVWGGLYCCGNIQWPGRSIARFGCDSEIREWLSFFIFRNQ